MRIRFIENIREIRATEWNALCADDYPFVRHEFLAALEQSDSLGRSKGWQPQHLLVEDEGEVIAALPLYLKFHSYGEYVFDWSWADAYQRFGLDYYPKLITSIPFTPCAGARLLLKNPSDVERVLPIVLSAIKDHAQEIKASGWHCLFPTQQLSDVLNAQQVSQRIGCQFHWFNRGYTCWDDFVGAMQSRKRKNINKERRQVSEQGIVFSIKTGTEITSEAWALFYQFYRSTYLKRSGHEGYLTEDFFQQLHTTFADYCVMIVAQDRHQVPIAAALFFKDATTLYGRYWGCLAEYDFLHFETCYYQGIDYAIQQGLQHFDGGAQGEHKIQRGFEPIKTFSNHWLAREDFHFAINDFLKKETPSIEQYIDDAATYLPFKE